LAALVGQLFRKPKRYLTAAPTCDTGVARGPRILTYRSQRFVAVTKTLSLQMPPP
jgi:hypothetical protein